MLTKDKYCSIRALIDENMTRSRMLWSCMYTIFFATGWVSFYSTEFCTQLIMTSKSNVNVRTTSIYVATGFLLHWLLFLIVPLATHVIHEITKERVESLKRVYGARRLGRFLMFVTYLFFSTVDGNSLPRYNG